MSRRAAPPRRYPWLGPRLLATTLALTAVACAAGFAMSAPPLPWWLVGVGLVAGAIAALVAVPAFSRGRRWLPARAVGWVLIAAALGLVALTWVGIIELKAGRNAGRGFLGVPMLALFCALAGLPLAIGGDRVAAALRTAYYPEER